MAFERPKDQSLSATDRLSFLDFHINAEILLYLALIALAIVSRFHKLGERVMSHDETTHVYFSWLLSEGQGYQHDPLSHGPLQFHLISLSYFLFGDTDTSARVPVALFGVLAIGLMWGFRRYLGRSGAFVAGILLLISPYMLYYSRYTRNEMLVVPLVLLTVWSIFRYTESREPRWLYLFALSSCLHFTTKETSFIFTSQVFLFLFAYLAWRFIIEPWERPELRVPFFIGLSATILGVGAGIAEYFRAGAEEVETTVEALEPGVEAAATAGISPVLLVAGAVGLLGVFLLVVTLIRAFGKRLQTDFPSLDLFIVTLTMTLPQLAALPAKLLGWDALALQDPSSMTKNTIAVLILTTISAGIGLLWNWRRWLIAAVVFFVPYIVLYTTMFTNGLGFPSGLVRSLGYWLVQHDVERGSQPHFYYALIQLPIYEFLPSIGALIASAVALRGWFSRRLSKEGSDDQAEDRSTPSFPVIFFIGYWAIFTLLIYSFAGERMPWITVHITLPLILLSGWVIGKFLDSVEWNLLKGGKGWVLAGLLLILMFSSLRGLGSLLGTNPPFKGYEIPQINATVNFLTSLIVAGATFASLVYIYHAVGIFAA